MMKRSLWIKAILPSLLLVLVGVGIMRSSAPQPSWQLAREVAPAALLTQMMQDNVNPETPFDPGQMRVLKWQQRGQPQPLYLVDAHLSEVTEQPLCGAAGCAFFAYRPDQKGFQRISSTYLNPHLPPNFVLLEPTGDLAQGLPVLLVNQLVEAGLQQLKLNFDGQTYVTAQLDYLPLNHE